MGGGLKITITFCEGWSQNHIQWGVVSKSHSVWGGLKITITFSEGWSQNHIQWGVVSKSHSVGGGLKITFSGGWSQNHIQWGVVSKSHSVGGGLKITFSGGWSQNHIQCGVVSNSHTVGGGQAPREHCSGSPPLDNNQSFIIFFLYFSNDNFMICLYTLHFPPFFSQNKAEDIFYIQVSIAKCK